MILQENVIINKTLQNKGLMVQVLYEVFSNGSGKTIHTICPNKYGKILTFVKSQ